MHIHSLLKTDMNDWMLFDASIQTNLINMYNKCGRFDICKEIFAEFIEGESQVHNISVWIAMIQCYGDDGDLRSAQLLYTKLRGSDMKADKNTFAIMINICAHFGESDQAIHIWENEICDDRVKFDDYIIAAMVSVYSKNGMIDRAQEMMQMQSK